MTRGLQITAKLLCLTLTVMAWPLVFAAPQATGTGIAPARPSLASVTLPLLAPLPVLPALGPVRPHVGWDRDLRACPSRGQFVRFFRMTVTAYTPINTRMEGGRWTVTERDGRAVHGIAVDPDLIPLGSHVWIPGYGHAVADDIGGRIHGHHVDLRLQERAGMDRWGVRQVRVYILDDPPGGGAP